MSIDFLLGFLFSPLAFVILLIVALIAENKECRIFGGFVFLIATYVLIQLTNPSTTALVIGAIVYLPIGVVWSRWRLKSKITKTLRKLKDSEYSATRSKKLINFKELIPTIVYWVMVWPVSALEHAVGDFIELGRIMVTKWFRTMYVKMIDAANEEIDKISKQSK